MRISFLSPTMGKKTMPWSLLEKMEKFLVVPEGEPVPEDLPEDITPLLQPLTEYVPGSYSAMDIFLPFGCSGSDHPFRYRPFRLVFRGTAKKLWKREPWNMQENTALLIMNGS